jgi:hypothetical protein
MEVICREEQPASEIEASGIRSPLRYYKRNAHQHTTEEIDAIAITKQIGNPYLIILAH